MSAAEEKLTAPEEVRADEEKLRALEERAADLEGKLRGKILWTKIVYAILIAAVACYTTLVARAVKELTSPEALSEHVRSVVSITVPERRSALVEQLKGNTDDLAKAAIRQIIDAVIPAVEAQLKSLLAQMTAKVAHSVESQLMPAFGDFIKADAKRLKQDYAELVEAETGEAIVTLFISVIEQELDKYLNDHFIEAMQDLQVKIRDITKPGVELTKRQEAQRSALVSWAFLSEHGEMGSSVVFDALGGLKERLSFGAEEEAEGEE